MDSPVGRLNIHREFSAFGSGVKYRGALLGSPPALSAVEADILAVVRHWAAEGIVVRSHDALTVDF